MIQIVEGRIRPSLAFSVVGALALLLVSCAGPHVKVLDQPVHQTKTARALTAATALDKATRDTLREEALLDLYRQDSAAAVRTLADRYKKNPSETRRIALAEISSDEGDRLTEDQPAVALGHYLDAAKLCEAGAIASIKATGESADRTLYDYSAARAARIIREGTNPKLNTLKAPGQLKTWRLSLAQGHGLVDPRSYEMLVPSTWLKLKGIDWTREKQKGFGASMCGVTVSTEERRKADPMMPQGGRGTPLNASFRFSGSSVSFRLQNLMTESSTTVAGRQVPLEGDFTAALASLYNQRTVRYSGLTAMLRPGGFEQFTGIYSVEPYRTDKTPLILVHGLMSSGESWLPFINQLLGNTFVRENYQILVFNYPSGNMISKNAADLRDGLRELQQFYDPGRRDPKMRNSVILGHSMGGVISNMQIRDSGTYLYDSVFEDDLDQLKLDAEKKKTIQRLLFYEANPDIDRAILLAAPFRGSAFASNRIGAIGAWLISLPFNVVESIIQDDDIFDSLNQETVGDEWRHRSLNSVNSLRPDNPTLHDVLKSPPRKGVKVHTIIAQHKAKDPLLESSDGVVPYTSARLEEADTEKVVVGETHRSMVNARETVEEVERILYEHLGKERKN